MKRVIDRQEQLDKKCNLLMDLGFEINHSDSNVEMLGVQFDFSATACTPEAILYTALKTMYAEGRKAGTATIRNQLKALIMGDDE